jgi:hypothetical protein
MQPSRNWFWLVARTFYRVKYASWAFASFAIMANSSAGFPVYEILLDRTQSVHTAFMSLNDD